MEILRKNMFLKFVTIWKLNVISFVRNKIYYKTRWCCKQGIYRKPDFCVFQFFFLNLFKHTYWVKTQFFNTRTNRKHYKNLKKTRLMCPPIKYYSLWIHKLKKKFLIQRHWGWTFKKKNIVSFLRKILQKCKIF